MTSFIPAKSICFNKIWILWLTGGVLMALWLTGCAAPERDPFEANGFGVGTLDPGRGPTIRPDWRKVAVAAAHVIDDALPSAVRIGGPFSPDDVGVEVPYGDPSFQWFPASAVTKLPPDASGPSLSSVDVQFGPYFESGTAVVLVAFDGDPGYYQYALGPETIDRLIAILLSGDE